MDTPQTGTPKHVRNKSLVVLALTVPAPSLGVLAAMVWWPDQPLGSAIFMACKLWLLLLPVVWLHFIEKKPLSWSPARKGGFVFGISSGIAISVVILVAYGVLGPHLLDADLIRAQMAGIGLDEGKRYLLGALYWITVNSILEEYVWRWFVVTKCEAVVGKSLAIVVSALFFTLHHIIALSVYMSPLAVVLCSTGIFIGGLLWSYTYIKYRSIWPCYVSHAIVDLCIFLVGAGIIFYT